MLHCSPERRAITQKLLSGQYNNLYPPFLAHSLLTADTGSDTPLVDEPKQE